MSAGPESRWQATLADLGKLELARKFPFDECFQAASARYDVPKLLLLAVARGESNFDPGAVSQAGAYGVMQIRWPLTARHLGFAQRADLFDA